MGCFSHVVIQMLCILTMSVSISCLLILYYSKSTCHHRRNWVKNTQNLYYFLHLHVNIQLSQNKKFLQTMKDSMVNVEK